MPHSLVPASELSTRLDKLRQAMNQHHPDWRMMLLDHKIDLYYLTGTMQDGALIITPDQAVFYVRRSYECAKQESLFPDIRPMTSFRIIAADFPNAPAEVFVSSRTMTLQKFTMLQKYLAFETPRPADDVLSALRMVKSEYELACMRTAGRIHRRALEDIAPALMREGVSEARLCVEVCTILLQDGASGVSRFNQPMGEDVLGIASFGENSLRTAALDSPTGTAGTCIAMKSIGSSERRLQRGDLILLDIPSSFGGYHTDKSISYFFGVLQDHPDADLIRAAHEQCIFLEREAAAMLQPGAVPAEVYEKILACVDPAFRDGFMNGCKFLGHSIGLTMDETPVLSKGFQSPVVAGMTFAIEPKIALPGLGVIGTENTYEIVSRGPAVSMTGSCDTPLEIIN